MIPKKFKGRFVYHFTKVENLKSILTNGLLSTNQKKQNAVDHHNIANQSIQQRRSQMQVPCGPGGVVHDYVPMYFAKRTPMLLNLVKSKNVDQIDIIYFAVSIEKLLSNNTVFTDASANTVCPPNFYQTPADLDKLDWNIIDSWVWSYHNDDERHNKMAEMLVHNRIETSDISHIIVWNKNFKNHVKKVLEEYNITGIKVVQNYHEYFKHHYFTDFTASSRKNIITGPRVLKLLVKNNVKEVIEFEQNRPKFKRLSAAIDEINNNFSCIKELADIEGLETSNPIHKEDVGEHSKSVAKLVMADEKFEEYSQHDQHILILSAYLHDIGKGPKSRWCNGVQEVDDEHPRKSLPMLKRILTEDIGGLSRKDIRRIHMLVIYDDLIGDIVANGRDRQQLFDVVKNKTDVDLLISLGKADMGAINNSWITYNEAAIEELRQSAYDAIEDK